MGAPSSRAVLFDLDGTVVDTAPDLAGAANDMRARRGLAARPIDAMAPMCSYGGRGMLAAAFDIAPGAPDYDAMYDEFITTYAQRMTRASYPYTGMRALLTDLADDGVRWGIVTNKPERLAVPLIAHLAFEPAPGCVIGGDTAGVAKPDPAPILLACERMEVAPTDCIYVGDSDRDIAAGQAAGMPTIAACYGYIPPDESPADWPAERHVESIAALGEAIQSLWKSY
ncbi:HAD family hydrolase [Salinisphaera sp. Q1T1-3]|uniref:HAD family hydrolase n=1 Tax=Salinisphaera sp. Q1T1-3 TaxID=2321229 RepID=UPI001313D852|nr:HAD-IA family hydrolase [Salinisphaera sp. Q1T1-3]